MKIQSSFLLAAFFFAGQTFAYPTHDSRLVSLQPRTTDFGSICSKYQALIQPVQSCRQTVVSSQTDLHAAVNLTADLEVKISSVIDTFGKDCGCHGQASAEDMEKYRSSLLKIFTELQLMVSSLKTRYPNDYASACSGVYSKIFAKLQIGLQLGVSAGVDVTSIKSGLDVNVFAGLGLNVPSLFSSASISAGFGIGVGGKTNVGAGAGLGVFGGHAISGIGAGVKGDANASVDVDAKTKLAASTFSSAVSQYRGLIQPFQQCRQTIVSSGTSPRDLQAAVDATTQLKIKITAVIDQYGDDCGCKSHADAQDLVAYRESMTQIFAELQLMVTSLRSRFPTTYIRACSGIYADIFAKLQIGLKLAVSAGIDVTAIKAGIDARLFAGLGINLDAFFGLKVGFAVDAGVGLGLGAGIVGGLGVGTQTSVGAGTGLGVLGGGHASSGIGASADVDAKVKLAASTFSSAVSQYQGLIQPFQQCRQTIVSSGSSPRDLQAAVDATTQLKITITAVIDRYGGDCGCKSHADTQDLAAYRQSMTQIFSELQLMVTSLRSRFPTTYIRACSGIYAEIFAKLQIGLKLAVSAGIDVTAIKAGIDAHLFAGLGINLDAFFGLKVGFAVDASVGLGLGGGILGGLGAGTQTNVGAGAGLGLFGGGHASSGIGAGAQVDANASVDIDAKAKLAASTFSSAVGQYRGLIQPFQQCRQTIVSSGNSPRDLQAAVDASAQLKISITAVIDRYGADCGCKSHANAQDLDAYRGSMTQIFAELQLMIISLRSRFPTTYAHACSGIYAEIFAKLQIGLKLAVSAGIDVSSIKAGINANLFAALGINLDAFFGLKVGFAVGASAGLGAGAGFGFGAGVDAGFQTA